jgi:acyl-CoA reductase-like NAD-dependent aldehyde dehydrogenase
MFTGSPETGRRVMERAARTLTPVSLELGGKDPTIVLADANLKRAANAAAFFAFQNGGQSCVSVERAYVEEPAYDRFVADVCARVNAVRQGVPTGPGSVEVGAMTTREQLLTVTEHVEEAIAKGARAVIGGRAGADSPDPGFFAPTVLVDVDHTMRIMTQETFGPTLPIMKVRSGDEAVRLANDSPYGLAASVWTRDIKLGEELCSRLRAGSTCVNEGPLISYAALELPMRGVKNSGIGSRHGPDGIRKYCSRQSLLSRRFAPARDPYMFPYDTKTTGRIGRFVELIYGRRRYRGRALTADLPRPR